MHTVRASFGRVVAVLLFLVIFVLGAAACNGGNGEELSLEGYLQQVESLIKAADQRAEGLGDPSAAESDEEAVRLGQEVLEDLQSIVNDIRSGLEDLNPPEEAQAGHDKMVEGLRGFGEQIDTARQQADGAQTQEEIDAIGSQLFEEGEAFQTFVDGCNELQSLAGQNEIVVELDCGA
jgi:hypothetical protein